MMKKLLTITEIAMLPKITYFLKYQRYCIKEGYQILIAKIEDLNKDYVKIRQPYLLYFLRNEPSKSVTVGSVNFYSNIILFS